MLELENILHISHFQYGVELDRPLLLETFANNAIFIFFLFSLIQGIQV